MSSGSLLQAWAEHEEKKRAWWCRADSSWVDSRGERLRQSQQAGPQKLSVHGGGSGLCC